MNTKRIVTFFAFFVLLHCFHGRAISQGHVPTRTTVHVPGSEPREHPIDITRMVVDVRFKPAEGIVEGRVSHHFTVLQRNADSILFDAIKMDILQATLGGKPVRYRVTDTSVIVYPSPKLAWDVTDSIAFTYVARPRRGIYFIGWNDATNRMRKQIWTQGQGIDNRHWIPMYDEMNDKMITETVVTFDSAYTVVGNGVQGMVTTNGDGTKTWHHRMTKPHASYLLMLAIGTFAVDNRTTQRGVPLHLYSYPEFPQQVEPTYRYSTEMLDWLEDELGVPYPWESYSQVPVADFIFGAMENTTATIFGDFFLTDARGMLDRSYFGVNVHELTHQWFGDLITGRSGTSIWLQESFATFYPHLYTSVLHGDDHAQWGRRGFHNAALAASEKDRLPIVHPSSGTARVYPKGAGVIDMMRSTFGVDETRRVIKHYLNKHAFANVQTSDLYLAFQDVLGLTPDWFFDQWLYRGGEPHYDVTWSGDQFNGRPVTTVSVSQVHATDHLVGYFRMPITIEVHYSDGTKDSVRPWIDGQSTTVRVPNPKSKNVQFVLFDPGSYVMKKLTFTKPTSEFLAQLKGAPLMIDRYDALVGLRDDTSMAGGKAKLLAEVFLREKFPSMRTECVNQAAKLAGAAGFDVVRRAVSDPSVEVRSAALAAYAVLPNELRGTFEALLSDSSYALVERALTKLAASFPDGREAYLAKTVGERGAHHRIRVAWLEIAFEMGDSSAIVELADMCGPSWEFITRQNAMNALKRLGQLPSFAARNIVDAALSANGRLASVAMSTLAAMGESARHKSMIRKVVTEIPRSGHNEATLDALMR
jgi:aminopeptidase N